MIRHKVEGQDYVVRFIDFGSTAVEGCIVSSEGDFANIYINSRICEAKQREALRHELEHLERDDLYSEVPVKTLEALI